MFSDLLDCTEISSRLICTTFLRDPTVSAPFHRRDLSLSNLVNGWQKAMQLPTSEETPKPPALSSLSCS